MLLIEIIFLQSKKRLGFSESVVFVTQYTVILLGYSEIDFPAWGVSPFVRFGID